jgi:hypothetical protein
MPGYDKTGPLGTGQKGRGNGSCGNNAVPGKSGCRRKGGSGRGMGRGTGMRSGCGAGRGQMQEQSPKQGRQQGMVQDSDP